MKSYNKLLELLSYIGGGDSVSAIAPLLADPDPHRREMARRLDEIIPLPRRTLREGSKVWVAREDSTLDIRPVTVVRMTPTEALISSGLKSGEQVILSSISGAVPGLKLRLVSAGAMP